METLLEFLLIIFCALIMGCACGGSQVRSDSDINYGSYKAGDSVPLYVSKMGPFQNPSETYHYFDLPFCKPDYFKEKKQTFGEMLNGDHLINAPYGLEFLVEKNFTVACSKNLTEEQVSQFRTAIGRDYYLQLYHDELPLLLFIGKVDKQGATNDYRYLLHNHIHFQVFFYEDHIVKIDALPYPDAGVDLTEDKETYVEFLYSVEWEDVYFPLEKRMEEYSDSSLFVSKHMEYHWFSLMDSCGIFLILIGGVVKLYIRVSKKEFAEGSHDEESVSNQEERGWKCIQDDVVRTPCQKSLLAAALGSGTQLLTLTILILALGLSGVFYPHNRGRLSTALFVIYTSTSTIAGYTSASFYCHLGGTNWLRNLLLTECLFSGPLLFTFCLLNVIATAYKATASALPFGTIIELALLWTLISFPLLLLGGMIGKSNKVELQAICPSKKVKLLAPLQTMNAPREIPPLPWYRHAVPQIALAGALPFSVMYFELFFAISSVWGHGTHISYKMLFITFILVLVFIALVNACLTCRQLLAEDHKWWWRSIFRGGSVGLYVYCYCIFYYYVKSDWSGVLQISFFFGYMACISYGISLMFGSVSFAASFLCVHYMYHPTKHN
ncbi:transmembrane 9 superfamily member 2-like [Humulus lupulus]|uniref:transmembrane 9 superfamily member 2-like n=1 Tax=Humulus lupulus TaxID=3486 RepID=UPI002B408CDE|nr:transmembrane 9 superfamily member 2-like [Humulus lupulus]